MWLAANRLWLTKDLHWRARKIFMVEDFLRLVEACFVMCYNPFFISFLFPLCLFVALINPGTIPYFIDQSNMIESIALTTLIVAVLTE